jgi:hypothetical protein
MYTKELQEEGGFDFSLYERNKSLNLQPDIKKFTKTGTTICAVAYKGGVVFGADTRATAGSIVMDLECIKVHELASNIMICGAGTAADLFAVINMMKSELLLTKMNTGMENRLSHVEHRLTDHLFKHMGHVGAHLIVGGYDINGEDIVNSFLILIIIIFFDIIILILNIHIQYLFTNKLFFIILLKNYYFYIKNTKNNLDSFQQSWKYYAFIIHCYGIRKSCSLSSLRDWV